MSTPYDVFLPELCPVCEKANWDEVNEEVLHSSGIYCSDACEREDERLKQAEADAEARFLEELKTYEAEIEAMLEKEAWR